MFIGGSPGGTAGGVKTTTVALLLLVCISVLRGSKDAECFGRKIASAVVRIRSHDHSGDVSDLGRRNRSDHDLRTKCRLFGHYVRGNVGDRDGGTVCGSDAAARKRKSGGTDVFDVCGQDRSGDDGACICRKGEKIESAPGTSGEAYHDRIEQTGDPAEKENEKRGRGI